MAQDLAHKRPLLLASLAFGLSYPAANLLHVPELFAVVWKMAAVGFLVPYALRKHHNGEFVILATFLALCALGDGLIEFSIEAGGAAFAVGHVVAIWLYSKHRRLKTAFSQKLLALIVLFATPIIGFFLGGKLAAGYSLFLGTMAAMAWSSNFPRYRVGIGAMLFVASDLLIFGREGGQLANLPAIGLIIWYSYYAAMVLIATGIVQTLVKRGHSSGEDVASA